MVAFLHGFKASEIDGELFFIISDIQLEGIKALAPNVKKNKQLFIYFGTPTLAHVSP